jgi:hypothetical protein
MKNALMEMCAKQVLSFQIMMTAKDILDIEIGYAVITLRFRIASQVNLFARNMYLAFQTVNVYVSRCLNL